ncbi:helix-turn-helix transcriptional regulator [Agathobaculum massiliense]|uniref:helix-turn-helix transcriptional regulator n=1 Tax=Agathobaculum massiliense TaxID=3014267 RepID=UPI000D1E8240|nr:helix-turn-helix transcriptional regulator [Agathobaculum massiliense]
MNRIKELRLEAGILQADLANQLKVRQNTVSTWETGRSEPDLDALRELSKIFNTSIDYILGNTDIKKAPSYEDAGLSTEEAELLRRFRKVSPALQEAALRMLETDQKKENS